jgi:integrase
MGEAMATFKLRYVHEYIDQTGKPRRYFRRGGKNVTLPGEPGSSAFMAAYAACLDQQPAPPPPSQQKPAGSFGRLVTDFYASKAFTKDIKASSRRTYRSVLEPLVEAHGHRGVSMMTHQAVERIINRIGVEKPAMANLTRAVLRKLMKFAIKAGQINYNPTAAIDTFKTGEHHTWTDAELRQFERRWPLGTRERLAYALLLYTAQRVGDVATRTRAHIRNGEIYVAQEKTGVELWIEIHPELERALKAYPANGLALIGKANGEPLKRPALTALMARAIEEAGLPDRCVAHGLRKAIMRIMAENGATSKQIAGVSGHQSLREIERYTKAADQRKLARAAMEKIKI